MAPNTLAQGPSAVPYEGPTPLPPTTSSIKAILIQPGSQRPTYHPRVRMSDGGEPLPIKFARLAGEMYNIPDSSDVLHAPPASFRLQELKAACIRRGREQRDQATTLPSGAKVIVPDHVDRKRHPEALEELLAIARSVPCTECSALGTECKQPQSATWKCSTCENCDRVCTWQMGEICSSFESYRY